MTEAILRKELHEYIDAIPKGTLRALKPLLSELARQHYLIETDLTSEEVGIIDEGIQEFEEHPENFITLKDYLTGEH